MSIVLPPYPNPVTDLERFLNYLATGTGEFPLYPNPVTDVEKYLAFLCEIGFTARGYYYNGAFYADAQHTEELPKIPGKLYYDNQSGTLYIYDGTQYTSVGGGGGGVGIDVLIGWKAGTTPDVTKIPAGVTVTYSGVTYTGTKAAGEATKGQIVLVALPDGVQPNLYTEYITFKDGDVYGWEAIGTTQIDLTDYYTKTEADAKFLEASDLIPEATLTLYEVGSTTPVTYKIYAEEA